MSKRNRIVERASDVNGGQYIQTNPSYNSGYEDGKKAGKEYCASEIEARREQVEKLRKERDELHRAFNQPVPQSEWEKMQEQLAAKDADNKWLRSAVTLQAEQLAALAEQNEKMRKVLLRLACLGNGDQYGNSIGNCIAQEALSLPDLATPVLNRIKAEAYLEAAEIAGPEDSYQDQWFKAKADSCAKLRAKADELEQSK